MYDTSLVLDILNQIFDICQNHIDTLLKTLKRVRQDLQMSQQ